MKPCSSGGTSSPTVSLLPPQFTPALLGPAVMLVWTQCMLYARYLWVDAGITTVITNYARCGFIVVLAAFALAGRFTNRFQDGLGKLSVVLMTFASLLFYLTVLVDEPGVLTVIGAICAGIGVTWGEGMWIKAYMRLPAREALFYALVSLGAFSCVGMFIGLVPQHISLLAGMVLPMLAYVMYGRSMGVLDAQEQHEAPAIPAAADNVYAREPRSSLVRILVGISLFSFVMGVSRGFPYGTSIRIGQGFQMVQHLALIVIAFATLYRTLYKDKPLHFVVLWETQLSVMVAGILLLSTYDSLLTTVGATVMAVANLCQVIFLWLTVIDFARHREASAFHALGAVWFCHLFFRETGRLIIIVVTSWRVVNSAVILAVLIGLIVVCMALMLTGPIPRVRPLFDGLCEIKAAQAHETTGHAQPETESPETRQAGVDIRARLTQSYGLTPRETDVALLLSEGRSTPYAAESLGLTENTVRGYTKQVYEKLGVHSKQQLIDFIHGV